MGGYIFRTAMLYHQHAKDNEPIQGAHHTVMKPDLVNVYAILLDRRYQENLFHDLPGFESTGDGYRARCPFHADNTSTFLIAADRATYFCFACSAQGDWIEYLRRQRGLCYADARAVLAEAAGITIELSEEAWQSERQRAETLESALGFFRAELWAHDEHAYLHTRGYTNAEIEGMGLGRYPGFQATLDYLSALYPDRDIARFFQPAQGRAAEFSIVIPYRDACGRLMGLYGRRPDESTGAKAYRALTVMDGLEDTPFLMYKARCHTDMVVVDGFLDALLTDAIGIPGVIGIGHQGLTSGLLATAVHYGARRLLLSLSTDEATAAAIRCIREHGLEAAVIPRPGEDTDAYIRGTCINKFGKLMEKAIPAVEWLVGR